MQISGPGILQSSQFKLLYFDEATQLRCWGDRTWLLGRRNLGWGDGATQPTTARLHGNLQCTIAGLKNTAGCLASRETFLKRRIARWNRKTA